MSSPTPDWTAVVERLEKLERQNRRMKQAGAVVLVLAAAVLLMGQAPATRTVEANEFLLKDTNGNMRAKLGMVEDEPSLTFLDTNGEERASLSLIPSILGGGMPSLKLRNASGEVRVVLDASEYAWGLHLNGEGWVPSTTSPFDRTSLYMSQNGPVLEIYDREGFNATIGTTDLITPRTGETHKTSAASVVLFDKDKNVLWKAP